jgi:hypothetical protein
MYEHPGGHSNPQLSASNADHYSHQVPAHQYFWAALFFQAHHYFWVALFFQAMRNATPCRSLMARASFTAASSSTSLFPPWPPPSRPSSARPPWRGCRQESRENEKKTNWREKKLWRKKCAEIQTFNKL